MNSISRIPEIGVISVTDAQREQGLVEEREQYINKAHYELVKYLKTYDIEVIDASQEINRTDTSLVAIYSYSDVRKCIKAMANKDVEALVIGYLP